MSRASFALCFSIGIGALAAFSAGCSDLGDSYVIPDGATDDSSAGGSVDARSPRDAKASGEKDAAGDNASLDSMTGTEFDSNGDSPSTADTSLDSTSTADTSLDSTSTADTSLDSTSTADASLDSPASSDAPEDTHLDSPEDTGSACLGVGSGVEATPNTATGTCPAGQENLGAVQDAAKNFCCSNKACFDGAKQVGTGIEPNPNTPAGTCAAGQTNTLTDPAGNHCCALEPCFNGATQVGTGIEATPDTAAGTCPANQANTLTDAAGNFCCAPMTCVGVGTQVEASPNTAAGTCPMGQTNTDTLKDGAGNFCCSAEPCFNGTTMVGNGIEANPNTAAGTCAAGTYNNAFDAAGNFCCNSKLVPCMTAGQGGCVKCNGNTSGLCTPTEAQFVEVDISSGVATAPGDDPDFGDFPNACYSCLWNNSCLDDDVHEDMGNECEDDTNMFTYAGGTTPSECEAVLSCILGSGTGAASCAGIEVGKCYCGTAPNSQCATGTLSSPSPSSVNGVCATQIAAGLGFPLGDGADIAPNLNDTAKGAGRATQIFTCAVSNDCGGCL